MSQRRVRTFFYGSFINQDVLKESGVEPREIEVAKLAGYDIRIEPLANLVRSEQHAVYGILAGVTHRELEALYSQDWVGVYHPEPVLAETRDGKLVPALCYISPETDGSPASADYIRRIVRPAEEYGFPGWFIERLKSFGK